jgi:DNA polymerase IV (archaeal DinB-like DNA polymerase)
MVMEPETQRIILHLDMDSFYASVETNRRPELRGKPVVVGADPRQGKGRGVVSTCSYEARRFGIRSAMPVSQAFVLCPHAVFIPPDITLYSEVSANLMAILRSYGFPFQQVSIDEAFLDVSPLGNFTAVKVFAEQVQTTIRSRLGLTCSIGAAQCKLVAKIASDFKKPAGLTIVEPSGTQEFLGSLPVRKIPGIGGKSELVLHEIGIRTIGDLASYDVGKLVAEFGRGGAVLHQSAQGIDTSEVEEHSGTRSISREITFETDTNDPDLIISTIDALAEDVYTGLVHEGLRFRTLAVKVRYQGFVTRTRARTLSHFTGKKETLQSCIHTLFGEVMEDRKIRLLGIRLSSFEKHDARQMKLDL